MSALLRRGEQEACISIRSELINRVDAILQRLPSKLWCDYSSAAIKLNIAANTKDT